MTSARRPPQTVLTLELRVLELERQVRELVVLVAKLVALVKVRKP